VGEEAHTGFWWGNLGERDHLENLGVDGRIIIKLIFKKYYEGVDLSDLPRIATGGGLL
jgi:hypothetical protein